MGLSRKMNLSLGDLSVGDTPMLVPSFSSRVPVDFCKTLETASEFVHGPILVSAYDVYYSKKLRPIRFPQLIFLDSGGYERSRDNDVATLGYYRPTTKRWTRQMHRKIVQKWSKTPPTVLISYDAPSVRVTVESQIRSASELFSDIDGVLKEILVKPESRKVKELELPSIIKNLKKLSKFDILGLTEKELGNSVLDRMANIARVRLAMEAIHVHQPIHVFGSLDPLNTPLYFIAGADIFDGLTWLRFIIQDSSVFYLDSYGPRKKGIHMSFNQIWGLEISSNHSYLNRLELDLRKFHSTGNFSGYLAREEEFFRAAREDLSEKIGEVV